GPGLGVDTCGADERGGSVGGDHRAHCRAVNVVPAWAGAGVSRGKCSVRGQTVLTSTVARRGAWICGRDSTGHLAQRAVLALSGPALSLRFKPGGQAELIPGRGPVL